MSQDHNRLNHATWECKYHVVFRPKYRKKLLFGQIRRQLGNVFRELARRKECQIEEGHLMPDHMHMLISIPPKYSAAEVIGGSAVFSLQMKRHPAERMPLQNRDTRAARRRRVLSVPLNLANQAPTARSGSVLKSILQG